MADDARPPEPADEIEFELVEVNDLSEEEMDDDLRAAIAEAEADIAAGRMVPHSEVMEWISRIGTPEHAPMPREWLKR